MTGTKLINSVMFKFTKLIDKLEKGIKLIVDEQCKNDDTIDALHGTISTLKAENIVLDNRKRSAENVAANLKKLLGIVD